MAEHVKCGSKIILNHQNDDSTTCIYDDHISFISLFFAILPCVNVPCVTKYDIGKLSIAGRKQHYHPTNFQRIVILKVSKHSLISPCHSNTYY